MAADLLHQLEQKVEHAVEVIQLLNLQIEDLEQENTKLKADHDKWRRDLMSLLKRFEQIDGATSSSPSPLPRMTVKPARIEEEDFMTV